MMRRQLTREKGTAAVELAIICAMAFTIIPFIFLFGRVFWQYNVLKQATYDAARYVASSSASRMITGSGAVRNAAVAMVSQAAENSGLEALTAVEIICMPKLLCPQTSAGTIRVSAMATITDPGFALFNSMFLDYGEFQFIVTAEVPYASRLPTR